MTEPAPEKDIFAWPLPQSFKPRQTPPSLPTMAQPQPSETEKGPSFERWPTLQKDTRINTGDRHLPQRSKQLRQIDPQQTFAGWQSEAKQGLVACLRHAYCKHAYL